MAIVLRIVSADGKKTIMKSLPGLPSHIKVPAGARVEVTEDERTVSLAQYVNEHANRDNRDETLATAKVVVETVGEWQTAEMWLDSLATPGSETSSERWFTTADDDNGGSFAGFELDALLIGGTVAAGAAYGVYELTKNSKPKDVIAPVAPSALDLATDDDTGSSNSDNIISKTTGLTISGIAEAGAEVELFNGSVSLGKVIANAQGSFSKDIDLAAGPHNISALATDAAGNVSAAATPLRIIVDTTVPPVPAGLDLDAADDSGSSNSDNVTGKTTALTITGTAEAGAIVELFDGSTSLGTVTAGSTGSFSKDVSLANGTHSITAKAGDVAGNASAGSTPLEITVDGTPPPAPLGIDLAAEDDTGFSNSDNITSKTSGLTIAGNAEPGASVQLFAGTANLGIVTADANGNFGLENVSLAVGTYAITAQATDANGNVGPTSPVLSITIDTAAPAAPSGLDLAASDDDGNSNSDNVTSKGSGLTISGTAEGSSTVELFDGNTRLGSVAAAADGTFSLDISLALGSHQITAKATDAAGNAGTASSALEVTVTASSQSLGFVQDESTAALHLSANPVELGHAGLFDNSNTFG